MRHFITLTSALSFFVITALSYGDVPKKVDILVLGAGLSGLNAAYQLRKQNKDVHIVELTPRIGGRVKTSRYDLPGNDGPIFVDSGMEEYWESNPAVKVIQELGLKYTSDIAVSSMVLNEKLIALTKDDDTTSFKDRIFGASEKKEFTKFETNLARLLKKLPEDRTTPLKDQELRKLISLPFSTWISKQIKSPRVRNWIRISVECEIGTEWNKISALDGVAEMHIFSGKGEKSFRILGGNEKFSEALAEKISKDRISLNQKVTRIVTKEKEVEVHVHGQEDQKLSVIRAKHVISTIPLYRLFDVQFIPEMSPKKRQAIDSQTYGSYFKIHVFLKEQAQESWIKNNFSILPILSDSQLGVIYDGTLQYPESKTKVLSLLVTGAAAEAFNYMNFNDVRKVIEIRLDALFPGIKKNLLSMEMFRVHPRAIAAWPVGRSRYDDLSVEIRRPENRIYFAGDFTETSHSDGAFISAERAVGQVLKSMKEEKND